MLQTLFPLIYVAVFLTVLLAVQSLASALFASQDQTGRINRRLEMLESGMSPGDVYSALVRRPKVPLAAGARISALYDRAGTFFRQAGLTVSPLRVGAIVIGV
jgi:tight adherence protein B